MKRTLPRIGGRILLAVLGIILGIVCAEFSVRLVEGNPLLPLLPPEPYIDNAVLYQRSASRLYELRPGLDETVGRDQVRIRVNAAGFRDDVDYPLAKAPGTYRIVVLGDSFTFAGKVQLGETFPRLLGQLLDSSDPSRQHQVLNLSVPGYNTEQEMLRLKEQGLRYDPDLVIVAFVLNDTSPMQQLVPAKPHFSPALHAFLKRLDLVQFVYRKYKETDLRWRIRAFPEKFKQDELTEGTLGWGRVEASLEEMKRISSANGSQLLVVIWPILVDLNGQYPHGSKHDLVARTCEHLGIPALDLLPTFTGLEASTLWANPQDHHPNARAHRLAAGAIFETLTARRLLSVPGTR